MKPQSPISLTRRLVAAAFTLVLGVSGCDEGLVNVTLPLLQTDEAMYALRPTDRGVETEIDYSFRNQTGGPVYLVNCLGAFGLVLQRLEDEEWVTAWGPVLPTCLSEAILIEEGEVFSDTLYVHGGLPGGRSHPQFDRPDPSGTYRIAWLDAYAAIGDHRPDGPLISEEYRVSNSFELLPPVD